MNGGTTGAISKRCGNWPGERDRTRLFKTQRLTYWLSLTLTDSS
jgi:hypothetical protein